MIRKAIILAGGKGSRLMPLTLAIPKEMIRVGVKPVIEHSIEVLKGGGIEDILIIVGQKKAAIMNYIGSGERLGVNAYYRIQDEPKGTAQALYQGKDFIGSEDFAVIYGDNYLKPYSIMENIMKYHESEKADATIVLHRVKDPTRFGIVKIDRRNKILGIIEKPTLKEAKSYRVNDTYLSIAGLMILNNIIFDYIEQTKPSKNNEFWLTDSIELMRKDCHKISGYVFTGTRYDIGTFQSLKEADRIEQQESNNNQ